MYFLGCLRMEKGVKTAFYAVSIRRRVYKWFFIQSPYGDGYIYAFFIFSPYGDGYIYAFFVFSQCWERI